MTRLFIDGREIESQENMSSVSQIIKCVDGTYLHENAVIKQIRVNGLPLAFDNIEESALQGIAGLFENPETVEIFTGHIAEAAKDSISEAFAYFDRVKNITSSVAIGYRDGPLQSSFDDIRHLYEGFYWLDLLIDRLEDDFKIGPENLSVRTGSEREVLRKFVATLKQLKESREKGEPIMRADALGREIIPVLPLWKEALNRVVQELRIDP